jgi:hypothetical protein
MGIMAVRRLAANGKDMKMGATPETNPSGDELRPEYDLRSMRDVVRGKYAVRYKERLRIVRLAAEVAAAFADESAVNEALREYLKSRRAG